MQTRFVDSSGTQGYCPTPVRCRNQGPPAHSLMYRHPNNHIYKTVVVVWLSLSIASVILAAMTWNDLSDKLEESVRAAAIRNELDSVLQLVVDTETGQRGYTITGDERFLKPLLVGEAKLPVHFDNLLELTRSDSEMLKKVVALRTQAELILEHHRGIVAVRKTNGEAAAQTVIARGEGKELMDDLRLKVEALRQMRADLVSDKGGDTRDRLLRAGVTSLAAGSLGIGAGAFAFWLARMMLGQQQRERDLIEAKLHAEQTSRDKTVFLANMSHEIRTPMNAILGFSELLEQNLKDSAHLQYIHSIRTSATSLLQLINDILDMSKIEAGVMELKLEPTEPRELCDFVETVFVEPAARKGLKLVCRVAEDLPRALLLDRIRLRQVLVNLVGNAVKFTDRGSITLEILWEKQETSSHVTLLIRVHDTGVGIPSDKLEQVFEPFVQSGIHRDKEKPGTGLGLSIVRRLTEMMGGSISVSSSFGEGSVFSLRLPNVSISTRLAVTDDTAFLIDADFNELQPSKFLVVDDNEVNCQLLAAVFAGTHHELTFAYNGLEAVNSARESKPDIILLDIRMPGMDGREALEHIRKIPGMELTPVIAVTASSLQGEESDLKQRFNGYIRKPFSRADLFDELAQFLPRHEIERKREKNPAGETATEDLRAPAELLRELQRLERERWPALKESLAINECKHFAVTLRDLGTRWNCTPLESYGRSLGRYADNYAVVELERQLSEYPSLLKRLEGSQSSV